MPHPDTDALVERIWKDARKALYWRAAQFFDGSDNQQRAGLDAHHLVSQVLERVLEGGNLHKHPNPKRYIMKAITNAGIDAKKRHDHYERIAPHLIDPTQVAPLSHETAATDKLVAASVLEDAIPALPERAKRVARAKVEHPDLNINQLAAHLDVSRDTVRRAFNDMNDNEVLRGFVQPEAEPQPTANSRHPEENP